MNDLIYLAVRGQQYRAMLDCCLGSLRTTGEFRGDIMIFCPDVCPVIQAACDRWDAVHRSIDWHNPQMVDRVYALRQLEVAVYDTVTCLDVDVVACRPVAPLLADHQHVRYFNEPWQSYRSQPAGMYIDAFTPEECNTFADEHCINVGHITWPSTLHQQLTHAWVQLVEKKDWHTGLSWGWDQATFQAVIRRELVPALAYAPMDVCNALKTPRDQWRNYCLVHFAGHGDRLRNMQELAALT